MPELYVSLTSGNLSLVPLAEVHREGLRAACSEDNDIWEIYPVSYAGDAFDAQFDAMLSAGMARRCYAILCGAEVVGMTAWIESGAADYSIEIGNTYIVPRLRGSGFNNALKKLMLDHAFACGMKRVGFKVDEINTRSQAAMLKIGAMREGVLRADRITWTGRVRSTVVFSILDNEWPRR